MIIAERGASSRAPENTLPAFILALKQGCMALEMDVHLSKDGEVVVCHDVTIDRTSDGTGYIGDQTLHNLRQRDYGFWFSDLHTGTTMPTLREVLDICPSETTVVLDLKGYQETNDLEEIVVSMLDEYNKTEQALIISYNHYRLQTVKRIASRIRVGLLYRDQLIEPWRYAQSCPFDVYSIHPHYAVINPNYVRHCRQANLRVIPYAVHERKVFDRLMQHGVHGVLTPVPDRFLSYRSFDEGEELV